MSDLINLACSACGNEKFHQPTNPKPNDQITCAGCGAHSTYGELQRQAEKQLQKIANHAAKEIARKLGN